MRLSRWAAETVANWRLPKTQAADSTVEAQGFQPCEHFAPFSGI